MSVELVTYAERPDLREKSRLWEVWAEFLRHDRTVNENFERLYELAPQLQFYALDGDAIVAQANTLPVAWDGTPQPRGIDWAFTDGLIGSPTTLCAIQVMVAPANMRRGSSTTMLRKMTGLARDEGLDCLIAPVRPTLKHLYPLIPMNRYIEWRRDDGELFDPWLRTHERCGAEVLAVAPESMRVEAPVAEWERWTGIRFPDDGEYVLPEALVPVRVAGGVAVYVEPNVWMRHPLPDD
jgi:hypothetical protein